MTTADYLFGQNWVEQFKRNLVYRHHLIENILITSWGAHGPFGRLPIWDATPEGRRVWTRRYEAWVEHIH